jgi:hypothetical protein
MYQRDRVEALRVERLRYHGELNAVRFRHDVVMRRIKEMP